MTNLNLSPAASAFVYGFPLVFNLENVLRYVSTGVGANPAAPFNSFSHARQLSGPDDHFVTLNNDTVYSMAQLDLSDGPVVLEVPNTEGRYYVLQFVSAWTDNFAYVGTRATGSDAGKYLITPPGWSGDVPADTTRISAPTSVVSIVGRWAVRDQADLSAVHQLQDATILTPTGGPGRGIDSVSPQASPELGFWEKFRVWSAQFPPAERYRPTEESIASDLVTGPIADLAADSQRVLEDGYREGIEFVEATLRGGFIDVVNGWQIALHTFDYNADFFEIGTVNSDQWQIADQTKRLVVRAGAAMAGLWGNNGFEAAYFSVYDDADGASLTGEHDYTLTLNPLPPAGAFWSLTMYDAKEFFMVDNPIDRYSLGDRTPGLRFNDDGGLTIYMSHSEPPQQWRSNWLPTPEGRFRPVMRVYIPGQTLLDGSYVLPAIHRVV